MEERIREDRPEQLQIAGVTSFVGGRPLTVGLQTTRPTDSTGTASLGALPIVVANLVLPKGQRTFERAFNTDAVQIPPVGSFGKTPKGVIRGPGINTWDIAIFKNLPIGGSLRLQFRWEMFNAFNHTRFAGVDTVTRFDSSGAQVDRRFGQYTSARDARITEFTPRVYF